MTNDDVETTSDRPTSGLGRRTGQWCDECAGSAGASLTGLLSYSVSEEDGRSEEKDSLSATEEEEADDGSEESDSDERYATIPLRPAVAPPPAGSVGRDGLLTAAVL